MSVLERAPAMEAAANDKPLNEGAAELPSLVRRRVSCARFTLRRSIGCLCEIARRQLNSGTIPRSAIFGVLSNCNGFLGVGRSRFSIICDRMGFRVAGNPQTRVMEIQEGLARCGRGTGVAALGALGM